MTFNATQVIVDTNYHVDVQHWSKKSLSKGNRKKIRQFYELGGIVSYSNVDVIKQCYEVLVENRKRRGVALTMQYADFESSLLLCGEDFKLIQAFLENKIVAACYLVKILPDYWYVLFWGELVDFRSLSPVASMFQFLIEEAQRNRVKYLDLGISSVEGVLDEGLARFKSNLGAVSSQKITLSVNLMQD
jgi:lipid II:glycine glycyltransferase (peptidoglycan interpeptide bridge formation enzyme)